METAVAEQFTRRGAVLFVGDIVFILDCRIYKSLKLLRHVDSQSRDTSAVDVQTKRNAMIRSAVVSVSALYIQYVGMMIINFCIFFYGRVFIRSTFLTDLFYVVMHHNLVS
jgi:hypothetical protein